MRQQLGLKLEQKVEAKAEAKVDVKVRQQLKQKLSERLRQKLNAHLPIEVTELGMVTDVRLLHPLNAPPPEHTVEV